MIPSRRSIGRRALLAFACISALAIGHAPLLRLAARPLVVPSEFAPVTAIAIHSGDRRYQFTAEQIASGNAERVLLTTSKHSWIVECGAEKPGHELARLELIELGVPADRITRLPGRAEDVWDATDRLNDWLDEHPGATVSYLVDLRYTRTADVILHASLAPANYRRVTVHGLQHREVDLRSWWTTRRGIKGVFSNYIWLGHALMFGRPPRVDDPWNPDRFEERLARYGKQNDES